MATHSSILAWRIPWTEEPGGLQSTALQSQTLLKRLSTHAVKKTKESHWQNVSVNILYSCKCFGICSWSWRQEPRMGEGCILCCVCLVAQLCLTLRDPMEWSPPGSSVHGILQARILEWITMPSSRGSSQPRDGTHVSCISSIGRQVFSHSATWEAQSYHMFQQFHCWEYI